jgi:hypothetical protein
LLPSCNERQNRPQKKEQKNRLHQKIDGKKKNRLLGNHPHGGDSKPYKRPHTNPNENKLMDKNK